MATTTEAPETGESSDVELSASVAMRASSSREVRHEGPSDDVVIARDGENDHDDAIAAASSEEGFPEDGGSNVGIGNGTADGSLRRRRRADDPVRAALATLVAAGGPNPQLRTVSYELYDSELWNRRKVDIQRREGGGGDDVGATTRHGASHQRRRRNVLRLAVFGIGFVAASVGFLVARASEFLGESYLQYLGPGGADADMTGATYGRYLGFSLLFAVASFVPVALVRPVAAGSGIAEAKAVLNGIKIPNCTEILSAACKAISTMFAVASALPAGLEGPLIFIGMAIGENAYRLFPHRHAELRSWRVRRDLAAVGTAAGVSVAFLSPIGGILFAAEEGASYVTARLLTQCFAAAITVVVFDYFYSVVGEADFALAQPFARSLARFNGLPGQKDAHGDDTVPLFAFYDYFVIAFVGVIGGAIGACFVRASKVLMKARRKYVKTFWIKLLELLILAVLATTLFAWLPSIPGISRCQPLGNVRADQKYFLRLNCEEGEFNDLATLLRNPLPSAINLMFWEPQEAFSMASLLVAGATMLFLLLLSFGASISMGIFVPLLYIGAAFGRAWATISPDYFHVTTYAVVGAAASLNGVIRVLISLTVIMMETTNLAAFASPLMIVCLASRWAGNTLFREEGIYDEILKIRGIPFLEAEPPEIAKREVLRARDIMSKEFVRLDPIMRISDILLALKQDAHVDFIVTDVDGVLRGSISRAWLIVVIWNKKFWSQNSNGETESVSWELSHDDFDFDRVENITNKQLDDHLNGDETCHFLNIAEFMRLAPITFAENGSAERAYELFRTHGLRQLIIVCEKERKPVGVMTRHVFLKCFEEEEGPSATPEAGNGFEMEGVRQDSVRISETV